MPLTFANQRDYDKWVKKMERVKKKSATTKGATDAEGHRYTRRHSDGKGKTRKARK